MHVEFPVAVETRSPPCRRKIPRTLVAQSVSGRPATGFRRRSVAAVSGGRQAGFRRWKFPEISISGNSFEVLWKTCRPGKIRTQVPAVSRKIVHVGAGFAQKARTLRRNGESAAFRRCGGGPGLSRAASRGPFRSRACRAVSCPWPARCSAWPGRGSSAGPAARWCSRRARPCL